MLVFDIELTPDEGTLLVRCPDLPEVVSFGEDQADAMGYAVGAIEEALAARMAHKEDIPLPSLARAENLHPVHLSKQIELAVELYRAFRKASAL